MQTDRPHTEFWNSGNVEVARDLSAQFAVNWIHMTSQAHHGKVRVFGTQGRYKKIFRVLLMESLQESRISTVFI